MSEPLLDLLTKGGPVAAVLGAFVYLLWRRLEAKDKEQREDRAKLDAAIAAELTKLRLELAAALAVLREDLANLPDWLAGIHSRLGDLGADSNPPPPRRRKGERIRIQTAPVGWPTAKKERGDE